MAGNDWFPRSDLVVAVRVRRDRWRVPGRRVRGVVVAAAVLLTACGSTAGASRDDERVTTTSVATSSTTIADPNALRMGQKTETKEGNVVQLLAYQQSVPATVLEPGPGTEFAAVEAEICAGPRRPAQVTAEGFKVEMADGSVRGRSFLGPKEPALTEARLAPGACVRGWVNFEVPQGRRPAYVVLAGSSLARWAAGGTY